MDVQIKIQGVDVVRDVFSRLPKAMQNRAARPAMKQAMQIVRKATQANIEASLSGESTGRLRKSLRVYNLKARRGVLRTAVMVQRGLVYPGRFYKGSPLRVGMVAGIFEYGKKNQPPKSPFRNAARQSVGAVLSAVNEGIKKNLEKALNAAKSKQP